MSMSPVAIHSTRVTKTVLVRLVCLHRVILCLSMLARSLLRQVDTPGSAPSTAASVGWETLWQQGQPTPPQAIATWHAMECLASSVEDLPDFHFTNASLLSVSFFFFEFID